MHRVLRLLGALTVVVTSAIMVAPVASADPAEPTNYRSTVESIKPATTAIDVSVVGGDGFLSLTVQRGHTVAIKGYQDEPWLRVSAKGLVEENQAAPTHFLNENRYGTVIPPGISVRSATSNPNWKTVATNGRFIWHDHRIHYMTPKIPPRLVPGTRRVAIGGGPGGRWQVPITVDGTPTTITGSLEHFPAPSPVRSWIFALVTAVVVAGLGFARRRWATAIAAATLIGFGGVAVWAGLAELSVVPAAAGGNPLTVALPGVAIVAGLISLALRSAATKVIALLGGAAALGAWAMLRIGAINKAFPLGSLTPGVTRTIIAMGLGAAVGTIGAAIASGGFAIPLDGLDDLDDDIDDAQPPAHVD